MKYFTYTNIGCIDLCRNMIASLQNQGVKTEDIYVHCMDRKSLDIMLAEGNQAYIWREMPEDLHEYQEWSFDPASSFSKIVSWKWKMIRHFYQQHKEFLFVDSDIVFKKNVEEDLRSYGKNICIQCDIPGSKYCTGFMYFKESPETAAIINACANNHMDDQLVFNKFVNDLNIESKIQLLDIHKYPNGHVFYKTTINKNAVYMIHNNHMIGKQNKIDSFVKYENWYI